MLWPLSLILPSALPLVWTCVLHESQHVKMTVSGEQGLNASKLAASSSWETRDCPGKTTYQELWHSLGPRTWICEPGSHYSLSGCSQELWSKPRTSSPSQVRSHKLLSQVCTRAGHTADNLRAVCHKLHVFHYSIPSENMKCMLKDLISNLWTLTWVKHKIQIYFFWI